MRRAEALFLVALSCAAAVAAQVRAQQSTPAGGGTEVVAPTFTLTADEVSYDRERDLYEALGHVRVLHSERRTLNADWLACDRARQVGVATSEVRGVRHQE